MARPPAAIRKIATVISADLPRLAVMRTGPERSLYGGFGGRCRARCARTRSRTARADQRLSGRWPKPGTLDLRAIYAANLISGIVDATGLDEPTARAPTPEGQEERLMTRRLNLNADLGEGFGAWQMGSDAELLRIIGAANIACGFHAGDPLVMRQYGPCRRSRPASASARTRRFPTCRASADG
jgi:hypothetical protein